MTGLNKGVLEEKAAEVMAAMTASIADIDVREGTFIEAVKANVIEANELEKTASGEVIGVGYIAHSDEDVWYVDREKTLKHFGFNSVADLVEEMRHPKARLSIKRFAVGLGSLHDRIATTAEHLREMGATKLIVYVDSNRVLAKPEEDKPVMFSTPHLGQLWHYGFKKTNVNGSFGFDLSLADDSFPSGSVAFQYKPLPLGTELPSGSLTIDLGVGTRFQVVNIDVAYYHSPEGPEHCRLAFDLLHLLLKQEGAIEGGLGDHVDLILTVGEICATERLDLLVPYSKLGDHLFKSKLFNERYKLRNENVV